VKRQVPAVSYALGLDFYFTFGAASAVHSFGRAQVSA
jgi:hypothetical protein